MAVALCLAAGTLAVGVTPAQAAITISVSPPTVAAITINSDFSGDATGQVTPGTWNVPMTITYSGVGSTGSCSAYLQRLSNGTWVDASGGNYLGAVIFTTDSGTKGAEFNILEEYSSTYSTPKMPGGTYVYRVEFVCSGSKFYSGEYTVNVNKVPIQLAFVNYQYSVTNDSGTVSGTYSITGYPGSTSPSIAVALQKKGSSGWVNSDTIYTFLHSFSYKTTKPGVAQTIRLYWAGDEYTNAASAEFGLFSKKLTAKLTGTKTPKYSKYNTYKIKLNQKVNGCAKVYYGSKVKYSLCFTKEAKTHTLSWRPGSESRKKTIKLKVVFTPAGNYKKATTNVLKVKVK